jgi:hypothetical protein
LGAGDKVAFARDFSSPPKQKLKEPDLEPRLFQFNETIVSRHIRVDWTSMPKTAVRLFAP